MNIGKVWNASLTIVISLIAVTLSHSQVLQNTIKGQLLDSVSGDPLGFATVRVFDSKEIKEIAGKVSDENGRFFMEVPEGIFIVTVDFIGYNSFKTPSIKISNSNPVKDLGIIKMSVSSALLNEVVVQGKKSTMELSLDKKTFHVGTDLSNAGGTASDILSNIPSVSVDAEGNVKLRGGDNVRILIDGKPSGLVSFKGGSGLQQLQGSLIEKVEIITNPSARYEAEGMSGIINIVLKKEKKQGFNGSFELIAGDPTNLGASANINFRHKKINFFINYGIAYRIQPNRSTLYQEVYREDSTFILRQNNKGKVIGFNNNIRGGLDYYFNDKNSLTLSYLFRRSDAERITNIRYEDYLFNTENSTSFTNRRQDEVEAEPNSEYAASYKRTFEKPGQELTVDFRFLDNWERSDQTYTQNGFAPNGAPISNNTFIQKSLNDEFEKQYLFQLDYIHPIGEKGKVETGVRSSIRDMVNDYVVTEEKEEGGWETLPLLDNYFIYNENIHAVYGIYGNKVNKFSYQLGLRGELTDVKTTLEKTNEVNPREYYNLFPSVHFTYDLPKENAVQLSYSRRVRRPRYNDLSPFMTFVDSRNFFSGNPNLNPEFTDAFELGHIKYFDIGSFTSSVYYRHTVGKIQGIRTVNEEGFSISRPENLDVENAYGAELTTTLGLLKWWKQDLNFNFFRAITDGKNLNERFESDTYSWFVRSTSKFTVFRNIDLQVRGSYEAPQKMPQGHRKALYYLDLAMSKDIIKGKGTVTLNVQDVFNSRRMRSITEGENFYTRLNSQYRVRQINLTVSYRLNQSKQADKGKKKLDGAEE